MIKGVTETVENRVKEQKGRCSGLLAATLPSSLLGSMLSGKGVIKAVEGTIRVVEGTIRAGQGRAGQGRIFHVSSSFNFEIEKYYYDPRFNGVYSRNNLPKIKDGKYVINLDKYESIGTHCIALHVNGDNVTDFDSFRIEHIPKRVKKFICNRNITTNIFRIQIYDSIRC